MNLTTSPHVVGFLRGQHILVFSIDRIIRIEGWSNYSRVHFTDHPPILMARVLRSYQDMLNQHGFLRTHKSHLVNTRHIVQVQPEGKLLMTDKSSVAISRRKRVEVRHTLLQQPVAA